MCCVYVGVYTGVCGAALINGDLTGQRRNFKAARLCAAAYALGAQVNKHADDRLIKKLLNALMC